MKIIDKIDTYLTEMYVLKSKKTLKKWIDEFTKLVGGKVENEKLMNSLKMKNLSAQDAAKEYKKKQKAK
jgi:regulator of replication initiation timing